jgi:hypothetical protein
MWRKAEGLSRESAGLFQERGEEGRVSLRKNRSSGRMVCLRNRYEEKSSEIEQMRGSQAVDQSWRLSLVRPGSLWDVVEAKLTTAN